MLVSPRALAPAGDPQTDAPASPRPTTCSCALPFVLPSARPLGLTLERRLPPAVDPVSVLDDDRRGLCWLPDALPADGHRRRRLRLQAGARQPAPLCVASTPLARASVALADIADLLHPAPPSQGSTSSASTQRAASGPFSASSRRSATAGRSWARRASASSRAVRPVPLPPALRRGTDRSASSRR